jgi:hypothetical protein
MSITWYSIKLISTSSIDANNPFTYVDGFYSYDADLRTITSFYHTSDLTKNALVLDAEGFTVNGNVIVPNYAKTFHFIGIPLIDSNSSDTNYYGSLFKQQLKTAIKTSTTLGDMLFNTNLAGYIFFNTKKKDTWTSTATTTAAVNRVDTLISKPQQITYNPLIPREYINNGICWYSLKIYPFLSFAFTAYVEYYVDAVISYDSSLNIVTGFYHTTDFENNVLVPDVSPINYISDKTHDTPYTTNFYTPNFWNYDEATGTPKAYDFINVNPDLGMNTYYKQDYKGIQLVNGKIAHPRLSTSGLSFLGMPFLADIPSMDNYVNLPIYKYGLNLAKLKTDFNSIVVDGIPHRDLGFFLWHRTNYSSNINSIIAATIFNINNIPWFYSSPAGFSSVEYLGTSTDIRDYSLGYNYGHLMEYYNNSWSTTSALTNNIVPVIRQIPKPETITYSPKYPVCIRLLPEYLNNISEAANKVNTLFRLAVTIHESISGCTPLNGLNDYLYKLQIYLPEATNFLSAANTTKNLAETTLIIETQRNYCNALLAEIRTFFNTIEQKFKTIADITSDIQQKIENYLPQQIADKICDKSTQANYLKVVTGGNDPSISKRMQYSQYVRNASPKTIFTTNNQAMLEAKGLVFAPTHKTISSLSLTFNANTNKNISNKKIFI